MDTEFILTVKKNPDLLESELEDVITLGSRVFNTDLQANRNTFIHTTHIMGYYGSSLVSHALWYTRWMQTGSSPLLKTAFVDVVATGEEYRKQGFASSVLARFAESVTDYDIAALTTASTGFYERLGWQVWSGPVYFEKTEKQIAQPNDSLMVLSLPNTPDLDLDAPLTVEWRE